MPNFSSPLLEKIPEDQLEEYNRKKSELERGKENPDEKTSKGEKEDTEGKDEELKKEGFKKAKEELLNKLRATAKIEETEPEPVKPAEPNLKNVAIPDVEKNAADLKQNRKPIITRDPVKVEEPEAPTAPPDKYKEPIE